jgi:hypothetical protein
MEYFETGSQVKLVQSSESCLKIMTHSTAFQELSRCISGDVHTDPLRCTMLATDGSIFLQMPVCVVYPKLAKDVSETLRFAAGNGLSVHARGAGSGLTGAALGASVGVAGAALTKNDLGPAAIVGGLVGAAAGGLTTRDQIDIGDPIYREPLFQQ